MKKTSLRKSEIKELNEKTGIFGISFSKNDKIELVDDSVYYINDKIFFFRINDKIIPSLKLVLEGKILLKNIIVDMGAVKFVVSGADIMRPGIINIGENIAKNEIVCIIDEKNKKPLAIGEALFDAFTMNSMVSGKVVKNLHYVGDKYWNI